jgi:hypothetical protein
MKKRVLARGEKNRKDGILYTTMVIRFPLDAVDRMDAFCEEHGCKRSKFLEEAIYYTIQKRIVERKTFDLLPTEHSLNGGKKMVSFKLPTDLRNDADAAGATINHAATGFLVYSSLLFLDYLKG